MFRFRKQPSPLAANVDRNSHWINMVQQQANSGDQSDVEVDLANVECIDSRELGQLVKIHLNLRRHDRSLVLRNVHGRVLEVLELTRMDRLLQVRAQAGTDN